MTVKRLVVGEALEGEQSVESYLRPRLLAGFVGQQQVKDNLGIAIQAACARGEALDHVLLYGPPGLGKTTLAAVVAHELAVRFQQTSGPVIQIKGDLTAILTNVTERQVLFVDEVHRLQPEIEEILYAALEDFRVDIVIGQGPGARMHSLDLAPFTFVGATTRVGLISGPLRTRFGIILHLDFYTPEDLRTIVKRSAAILKVELEEEGAKELARLSRGTPRIANRLLRRVWGNVEALQKAIALGDPEEMRRAGEVLAALADEVDVPFLLTDLATAIRESQEGSERIRHIVQDLRDFSHHETGERILADVNQCLDSTANIVWPMMKHLAVLEKDYGDVPSIDCFPMQLKQVFMNLLVNAFQAIEESVGQSGGTGRIRLHSDVRNGGVRISVSDNGAGISPENLDHFFSPFFTT